MNDSISQIGKLRQVLAIEKEEELRIFRESFLRASLSERQDNGYTWFPVEIKNSEFGLGEMLVIEIERTQKLNTPHLFQAGKNVSLFSSLHPQERSLNGTIKTLQKNKVTVALNTDELPDWVDDGKLGMNIQFDENSYREMDRALETVEKARHNRISHVRDVLYGEKKASFQNSEISFSKPRHLNESQWQAVKKILLAEDVALVHGPPGTGKTTTMTEAVKLCLETEKQILVCAPSNTSVDVLTEKMAGMGLRVVRLGNPARVSEHLVNSTVDAQVSKHSMYKDLKNFRKNAEEYFRMASKYKRNFGGREREQRQLLYSEARKLLHEAGMLEDYMLYEIIDKAQVITCTMVGASSKLIRDKKFKTVFIDEAAQALEAACWIPILKAEKIVLAGDHHQLPPTVKSKEAEALGLGKTLFEKAMELPGISVMLNVQYRMHEHIMAFSNARFYGNLLTAHESVRYHTLGPVKDNPMLNEPLTFIDTAGCSFDELSNPESRSVSNPDEARLLLKHLKLLLDEVKLHTAALPHLSIGIISPYKEQTIVIDEMLRENEQLSPLLPQIKIKTIDGFQGQERDIIYISLVRSNAAGDIGFLSDTRRMNVAMTRARKKLVIFGDSATIGNHPFYEAFIEQAQGMNAYESAWNFLPLDEA